DRPHDHPYKSIFIFRLPSAVRGKAVKRSRRKSPRRTEADNVTTVRRHAPETVGTADARRRIEERTATHHTACSGNYIKNIFFIFTWLVFQSGIVPVAFLAPCIDIPVHVEQAQVVWLLAPDRPGTLLAVLDIPAVLGQQLLRLPVIPARHRPRPARILHLR